LRRNCLLRQVIEGKLKGWMEVTGRRGRRCGKLLVNFKERREYSHLNEETPDRSVSTASFRRGYVPDVRQTANSMNE
jgi:hypothetical protein